MSALMGCVVASDTGGYVAGVMFGAHPMAPAVSPKKSWEGFLGSVIFGVITGARRFPLKSGNTMTTATLRASGPAM